MSEVNKDIVEVKTVTVVKRDYAPHRRVSHRVCVSCGKGYFLSDNDAVFYIKKYGTLPLRCEECRLKNRVEGYLKEDNQ